MTYSTTRCASAMRAASKAASYLAPVIRACATTLLLAATGLPPANAQPARYALTTPAATSDALAAASVFGSGAAITDWDLLKAEILGGTTTEQGLYRETGILNNGSAMVIRGGQRFAPGTNRQYFVTRFDTGPTPSYLVHDSIGSLYLGSWDNIDNTPVLTRLTVPRNAGFRVSTASSIGAALTDIEVFGSGMGLADWNAIKAAVQGGQLALAQFYATSGIRDNGWAMVRRGADRFLPGTDRHYFIQRFDAGPYGSFAIHDSIGSLYLGSWNELGLPLLAAPTEAVPPLNLVNGSFETPVVTTFTNHAVGGSTLTGWTVVGQTVSHTLIGGAGERIDGAQAFVFNGENRSPGLGRIEQVVGTSAGTRYALQFRVGRFSPPFSGTNRLSIRAEVLASTGAVLASLDVPAPSGPTYVAWNGVSRLEFTAAGDATTIRFSDSSNFTGSSDVALDAVSLGLAQDSAASFIVFASRQAGNYDIYRVAADGTGLIALTNDANDDIVPIPSPDGLRIAYVRGSATPLQLRVMNADGTGDTLVTSGSTAAVSNVMGWTPDGSRILFGRDFGCGQSYIWSIRPDGTGMQVYLDSRIVGKGEVSPFDISPDGSRVVWGAQDGCWAPSYEVFTAPLIGGVPHMADAVRLTNDNIAQAEPTISPDGASYAYQQSSGLGGAGSTFIRTGYLASTPARQVAATLFSAAPIAWWPGSELLVLGRESSSSQFRIYRVNATTGVVLGRLTTMTSDEHSAAWLVPTRKAADVATAPVITIQPTDVTVSAPATATFTVSASGTAPLSYQWQLSTDGGGTWSSILAGC